MITEWKQRVAELQRQYDEAKWLYDVAERRFSEAGAEAGAAVDALGVAQEIAGRLQQSIHEQIAGIVSLCLESVFDDPYTFRVVFSTAANRTQVNLVFERNGEEIDPLTASGGGVVDVAAFALRLACLMLARPPARRLLILDEPFKFLSVEYHERIGELLLRLAHDMDVQIVMVTHLPALQIGNIISL